jgi:Arc/MetJ family transcription regulator
MKVTIDIDDDLMRRATRLTGLRTKREVVERALQTLARLKEQERIRRYRGKLPSGGRGPGSEIRKLRGADPELSPRHVLDYEGGARSRR